MGSIEITFVLLIQNYNFEPECHVFFEWPQTTISIKKQKNWYLVLDFKLTVLEISNFHLRFPHNGAYLKSLPCFYLD